MHDITVQPTGCFFRPDSKRVLIRPFIPADDVKVRNIASRALALSDADIETQLGILREDFDSRHIDIGGCWLRNFEIVKHRAGLSDELSLSRKSYVGALFSGEYALESAALFNPSLVAHPDQSGVASGALRFVLSLRATGEGHISSIEFRSGVILADGSVQVDDVFPLVVAPEVKKNPTYRKQIFLHKLREMGFENDWSALVMESLGESFTHRDLSESIQAAAQRVDTQPREEERTMECLDWLARSNYEVHFSPDTVFSQRVIFPISANESNGIEDARFVRFEEEDGTAFYCATYTAYNGRAILPQFIETVDFVNFRVLTLNGSAVQNKGMALFPRRINGKFAMISRQDDENLFLMFSENLHFWNEPQFLRAPLYPWEFVKIGNCGSPIETEHGWLVITHGVGPMRRYCIGAMLLDLADPTQIIGCLERPLIEPKGNDREGYVPNVVYSCGGIIHQGKLILPYALSDTSSTIGIVDLDELTKAILSK